MILKMESVYLSPVVWSLYGVTDSLQVVTSEIKFNQIMLVSLSTQYFKAKISVSGLNLPTLATTSEVKKR